MAKAFTKTTKVDKNNIKKSISKQELSSSKKNTKESKITIEPMNSSNKSKKTVSKKFKTQVVVAEKPTSTNKKNEITKSSIKDFNKLPSKKNNSPKETVNKGKSPKIEKAVITKAKKTEQTKLIKSLTTKEKLPRTSKKSFKKLSTPKVAKKQPTKPTKIKSTKIVPKKLEPINGNKDSINKIPNKQIVNEKIIPSFRKDGLRSIVVDLPSRIIKKTTPKIEHQIPIVFNENKAVKKLSTKTKIESKTNNKTAKTAVKSEKPLAKEKITKTEIESKTNNKTAKTAVKSKKSLAKEKITKTEIESKTNNKTAKTAVKSKKSFAKKKITKTKIESKTNNNTAKTAVKSKKSFAKKKITKTKIESKTNNNTTKTAVKSKKSLAKEKITKTEIEKEITTKKTKKKIKSKISDKHPIIEKEVPLIRYSDEDLDFFRKVVENSKIEQLDELRMLNERVFDLNSTDFAEENTYALHMAEQGTEAIEKEKIYSLIQRAKEYIQKLNDALGRIDDKTYGICRICKCLIARERLIAVPVTTLSAAYKLHNECPKDGIDKIEKR